MKNSLICAILAASLIVSPVCADQEKTQTHLQTLLGELLHLEQQLDARPEGGNSIAPGAKYRIKPGDSLGDIAKRAYGETNIKISLVMKLIVSNNPTAFFRNNANFIYADKVITIPSVDDFRSMLFAGDTDSLLNNNTDHGSWIRFP
jgi:nucleoid-associated protein YgaU